MYNLNIMLMYMHTNCVPLLGDDTIAHDLGVEKALAEIDIIGVAPPR